MKKPIVPAHYYREWVEPEEQLDRMQYFLLMEVPLDCMYVLVASFAIAKDARLVKQILSKLEGQIYIMVDRAGNEVF